MITVEKLCDFPIRMVQNNTNGILTGDVWMIGAHTGIGKSTLSRLITATAIRQDQPVVLYSLEDRAGTFDARFAWINYAKRVKEPLNYREWLIDMSKDRAKYSEDFEYAESVLTKVNYKIGQPAFVIQENTGKGWTLKQFLDSVRFHAEKGYKLFILDHIDCLITSEKPDEMVRAMDEICNLAFNLNIAIITYSQISAKYNQSGLCPGIDDLRGSKAKVQKPTIVLTMARHNFNYYNQAAGGQTYIRVLKNRDTGVLKCGVCYYHQGEYLDYYVDIKQWSNDGTMIDKMMLKDFIKLAKDSALDSEFIDFNPLVEKRIQESKESKTSTPDKFIEISPLDIPEDLL